MREVRNHDRSARHGRWWAAALLFAMVFPSVATWLYFIVFAGQPSMRLVYAITKVLQFAFPLLCLAATQVIEMRAPARRNDEGSLLARVREARFHAGIGTRSTDATLGRGKGVGLGLAFGAFVALLLIGLYAAFMRSSPVLAGPSDEVRGKLAQMGAASPVGFLVVAVFYSLVHSLLEEYYWRWFVFGGLRALVQWGGGTPAIVVSSLAFMSHHVIVLGLYFGEAWGLALLLSVAVAAGGAVWAWLYHRTGSLLGPWLSHLLVDAGVMVIGYDMVIRHA